VEQSARGFQTRNSGRRIVRSGGAAAASEWYKRAFGATLRPAEIKTDDSPTLNADENADCPGWGSPQSLGGSALFLCLYVEDVNSLFEQAAAAGALVLLQAKDSADGDRRGGVIDLGGHMWYRATHLKDVSLEEMAR
jgi:PhnB protein